MLVRDVEDTDHCQRVDQGVDQDVDQGVDQGVDHASKAAYTLAHALQNIQHQWRRVMGLLGGMVLMMVVLVLMSDVCMLPYHGASGVMMRVG